MLIIDRFEDKYAVCENKEGKMVNILVSQIQKEAKEGYCIEEVDRIYIINYEETRRLKEEIEKLTEGLWK